MTAWVRAARARRGRFLDRRLPSLLRRAYASASLPVVVVMLFYGNRIDPAYGMTWSRMFRLARRMRRTTKSVFTATSYKAHLVMAVKLLEIPPKGQGVVVECGCLHGGSTANLSLVCDIVGRELIVYDSFEGLPPRVAERPVRRPERHGILRGTIEIVQDTCAATARSTAASSARAGSRTRSPTTPSPSSLCFLDVDYEASLHDCVVNLWPNLTERGYVFIDEYVLVDYCALFFSERFWREYFDSIAARADRRRHRRRRRPVLPRSVPRPAADPGPDERRLHPP